MAVVTCGRCQARNRVDENAVADRRPVCGKCGAPLDVGSAGADTKVPRKVTDATFSQEVLQAGHQPVLLDCWAPWCGPCRLIGPVLDELAAESGDRYKIAKLNVDDNPQTAARFRIQSIPTLLVFKNGELVDRMIGVQSKQAIAAALQRHI